MAEMPYDAYDRLRIAHAVPDGSSDMEVGKAILLENNIDLLNGVAWDKGCYTGQELTARTKYRGLIKRRLFPVKVEGALPAPGTPVQRDGKEVGEIRSGFGNRAIAMLQIEAAREPLSSGDATIVVEVPDWMRLPEPAG